MTISFRKSFSAALLSGTVAIVTPALAGGLILAQANSTSSPNATGSTNQTGTANGTVTAQPANGAAQAAGANAAGSMNTNNGVNIPGTGISVPGTYGGMGTMQNGTTQMGTSPMSTTPGLRNPNGIPNLYPSGTAPADPLAKKPATPPQQ